MLSKNKLYRDIYCVLLIVILSGLAYANSFSVPFILDDKAVIVHNPIVKDLKYFIEPSAAQNFDKNLFEYITFKKRYVGYLTFALNYKVHGLDVTGYHIVNLLIHITNAALVYFLILLSFETPYVRRSSVRDRSRHIAVIAALLFAIHPIQTQSVTYIWQRVASLASLFYLLSFFMYVKARLPYQSSNKTDMETATGLSVRPMLYYLMSLVSAVLAMKTKEMAFTLPIAIALYEFMFLEGKLKKRVLYLLPLFSTMLIIPFSLINIDRPLGELISSVSDVTRAQTEMSRLDYLFTQFTVIVTYLRLLVIPINQNLIYEYPIYRSFIDPDVFLSFIFLFSLFAVCLYLLYRYRNTVTHVRLMAFGVFWFFITLSVESSVIPIMDPIFEHRMYLPSIGIFTSLCTVVFHGTERMKNMWGNSEKIVVSVLAVVVLVLSGTTYARNQVWKTEISIWEDVVKKSPGQGVAHNHLGNAYMEKGMFNEAVEQFSINVKLQPGNPDSNYNLGFAYQNAGALERAKQEYLIILQKNPDYIKAHVNIGIIYHTQGHIDKAAMHFRRAIELQPDSAKANYNLGLVFQSQGRMREAVKQYKIALRLHPDYSEAHNNLGAIYKKRGLIDSAISHFQASVEIKPKSSNAHNNLGSAYQAKGLINEAIEEYEIALALDPGHKKARENLAMAMMIKNYLQKQNIEKK
jgi:tetratricopeptide (TPR) repeat protein